MDGYRDNVNKDLQRKMEEMGEWIEEREDGARVVIGGDFNARTGREGGRIWEEGEEDGMEGGVDRGERGWSESGNWGRL